MELTVVTIRESAVDRAIEARKEGWGPDRILMMVSTDEQHHFLPIRAVHFPNTGKKRNDALKKLPMWEIKMNGTVSTIWGSPISGPTRMEDAIKFTPQMD